MENQWRPKLLLAELPACFGYHQASCLLRLPVTFGLLLLPRMSAPAPAQPGPRTAPAFAGHFAGKHRRRPLTILVHPLVLASLVQLCRPARSSCLIVGTTDVGPFSRARTKLPPTASAHPIQLTHSPVRLTSARSEIL